MKRFLLISFLFTVSFVSKSQITWDGEAADGQWATATNWVGDVVPGPADDVLLDHSVMTVTYVVSLPGGAATVSVNSLTITPGAGLFITFDLPGTNTGEPGFVATGPGDAIVLNNRSAFFNSSGAASNTPVQVTGATSFFRINNGGRYIHHTQRGHTTNLVEKLSAAAGTENGSFEFDVPGAGTYFVSGSNRTYGNLSFLSFAGGGSRLYASTGISLLTVNGNLYIYGGATYTFQITNDIDLKGDLNISSTGTLVLSEASNNNNTIFNIDGDIDNQGTITESGSGSPTLELNGTSNQSVTAAGSILNSVTFKMNNLSGATLNSALSLPYNLTLTAGNIDIGANNLTVAGTITGGGTNSYVKTSGAGYLVHPAVTTMTFPIGNSSYNPATITSGGGSDFYTRVIDGISPAIAFPTYGINRTWNIYASANTPGVTVAFQYRGADANVNVPQPQDMELLINTDPITPGPWSIVAGNSTLTPSGLDPFIVTTTTSLTISNSNQVHYALGKSGGWILPIDCIISTRAQKRDNTGIITWHVNSCAEVNSFEVQRSVNNSGFRTIGIITPLANQTDFSFTDPTLSSGTNLYRIKVNRLSGSSKYSNTVAILYNSNDILITSLAPNPVHNSAVITLSTAWQTSVDFKVFDISGRVVKQWQSNLAEGNNTISINVDGLPAGMYHVLASSLGAKAFSKFIKQ